MPQKFTSNEYRMTMVCVDSYENGILIGRFYNPYLESGETFSGVMQLLLKISQMLDAMNFPDSFMAPRSFAPAAGFDSAPTENPMARGTLATFALRVLFRQNASWQGMLSWLEGEQEQGFRSVLEMLLLMDTALRPSGESLLNPSGSLHNVS